MIETLTQSARAAWAWWLHEINGVLGDGFGSRLRGGERTTVSCSASGEIIFRSSSNQDGDSSECAALSAEQLVAIGASSGVVLELPPEWVLRQHVQLPLAAAPRARDAIGFMLDRLSPFPPSQVRYSLRVTELDKEARVAWAEVAIAPIARIEAAIAQLAKHGVRVARIEAPAPELKQRFAFDDAVPRGAAPRPERLTKALAFAALAVLGLGAPALVLATEFRAQSLEAEVEALRPDADRARDLIARTAKQEKTLADFRDFVDGPLASDALETLTQRIDNESWLFSIAFDRKSLRLHGFARRVPNLLRKISSPPFGEAELAGSIVSGQAGGKDRFDAKVPVIATP
jgi:general secretion pathway protein L